MDDLRSIVADVPNISRAAYEETIARIASVFYASVQNASLSVLWPPRGIGHARQEAPFWNDSKVGILWTDGLNAPASPDISSYAPSFPPAKPPLSPPLYPPLSHEDIYGALVRINRLLRATLTTIELLGLALVLVGVMLLLVCTGWLLLGRGSVCSADGRERRRPSQQSQSGLVFAAGRRAWPFSATTRATHGHVELTQLRPAGQEQRV